jgi:amino acid adenylation domain-containing protein
MTSVLALINKLREARIDIQLKKDNISLVCNEQDISSEMLAEVKAQKPAIIEYLKSVMESSEAVNIPTLPSQQFYETSNAQRRMWMIDKIEKPQGTYHISSVNLVEGNLNVEILNQAYGMLLERHEALRTSFEWVDDELKQKINPYSADEIFSLTFENIESESNQERFIQQYLNDISFELSNAPLIKMSVFKTQENQYYLVVILHHIIADGWSMNVLSQDLMKFYNGLMNGNLLNTKALTFQYKDFSAWQNHLISSDEIKKDKNYWTNQLGGEIPVLNLPTDFTRPLQKTFKSDFQTVELPTELTNQLRKVGTENQTSLYTVILAAIKVLIYRYSDQEDLIIGMPVAGRENEALHNQIGLYINTLAIRSRPKGQQSFNEFLKNIHQTVQAGLQHQQYPFDTLIEDLAVERNPARSALFDVQVVAEDFITNSPQWEGFTMKPVQLAVSVNKFDLSFFVQQHPEKVSIRLDYNLSLFKQESIKRTLGHLVKLFKSIVAKPNASLTEQSYLTSAEQQQLLTWGMAKVWQDGNEDETIVHCFENQLIQAPNVLAVSCLGESLTYCQLNKKANQLAHYLIEKYDIQADDVVGYWADRSEWSLVAMLGIMKAGGCYLPIAKNIPEDRINFMLADTNAKVLITKELWESPSENVPAFSLLDNQKLLDKYPCTNPFPRSKPESLAYIIYTSGSTGKPKATLIEHQGLLNHLYSRVRAFNLQVNCKVVQSASQSFDVSMYQSLVPFLVGGATLIYPSEVVMNPQLFVKNLAEDQATLIQVVPTYLGLLLSEWETDYVTQELPNLTWAATSGEILPPSIIKRWYNRFPNIPLKNVYGPTEASDSITQHDTRVEDGNKSSVTIGKPVDNLRIYIVDKTGKLCPAGVRGELWVAGVGVGRGYLNDVEKTQKAFTLDPFIDDKYARLYKTGDLATWQADGTIDFFGRIDHQIKLNGYRIELGEIENVLRNHEQVSEAVVMVKESPELGKYLVGYYTSENENDTQNIREHLEKFLPDYMVPNYLVQLEKIPFNQNGKVDKKQLESLTESVLQDEENYVAPSGEVENHLASIFQKLLGLEKVSSAENLFVMGLNSMKAIKAKAEIDKKYPAQIEIHQLFSNPTIHKLASLIEFKETSNTDRQHSFEVIDF